MTFFKWTNAPERGILKRVNSGKNRGSERRNKMKKLLALGLVLAVALSLAACGEKKDAAKTIVVGCNPTPMVDILNAAKPVLEKAGYTLEIREFTDYVLPNTSLEAGELDANYFQTLRYMNNQNEEAGLHLKAVAGVHIEPMGIYSQKITKPEDLKDGDEIAVPNDTDNMDRALHVLIQAGLLNDPGTANLSESDFNGKADTNPRNFKISPAEAANLPNLLPDVTAAVINGNYALGANLPKTYPAFYVEQFDTDGAIARTNFIVVKTGNENSEKIKALAAAIQSPEVKAFIEENYKGSVITSFLGADDIP